MPPLLSTLSTPQSTMPFTLLQLLPMTTQSLPSMLRSSPMVPAMLPDLTPLLFPMAESNTSSTPPTVMMVSLLMSLMRELLSTQRSQLTRLPQPQLTTLNLI